MLNLSHTSWWNFLVLKAISDSVSLITQIKYYVLTMSSAKESIGWLSVELDHDWTFSMKVNPNNQIVYDCMLFYIWLIWV